MSAEVYKLGSTLNASNSSLEQDKILAVLQEGVSIILDMTDCTYVSSAGLRVMLYSYKVAASKGQKLYLVGVSDEVKDVMEMTGFHKFFDFFNTVEECKKEIDN